MKTLLSVLCCLFGFAALAAFPPPLQHNYFTTNIFPVVTNIPGNAATATTATSAGHITGPQTNLEVGGSALADTNVFQVDSVGQAKSLEVGTNGFVIVPSTLQLGSNPAFGVKANSTTGIQTVGNLLVASGKTLSADNFAGTTGGGTPFVIKQGASSAAGQHILLKVGPAGDYQQIDVTTNGVNFSASISSTNGFNYLPTNAAPSAVTVGVTAPDAWVTFTNSGVKFYMPAWTAH